MRQPTLQAFTESEREKLHILLAAKVALMMGRSFEEQDWTEIYCAAKGIPYQDWSNLNLDINYNGLGVEQKKLGRKSNKPITEWCGTAQMHPAETRSIRVPSRDIDPNQAMKIVFDQYANNLANQREQVRGQAPTKDPDMRRGWLLYQPDTLREFLYFEERRFAPNANDYYAIWKENPPKGNRKGSINLWIYDKATKTKRYSVTTEAGAKIQPYFDVPPPNDPNLYVFTVQGEDLGDGHVRIWITNRTAAELKRYLGSLEITVLSEAIISCNLESLSESQIIDSNSVLPVIIQARAYDKLLKDISGKSDEHRMQLFVQYLRTR